MARRYEMAGRSAAMERTREAILDAAIDLFSSRWYDEVTLGEVASRAGVSQQTVVNHFGTKVGLYLAAIAERFERRITDLRAEAVPGDVDSIVAAVVADYEVNGLTAFRAAVAAQRMDELRPAIEGGRRYHRDWVERIFAPQLAGRRGRRRTQTAVLLATVLDVSVWHRLRHEEGLSARATTEHLRVLVAGVLAEES